jgi:hypothetical protein
VLRCSSLVVMQVANLRYRYYSPRPGTCTIAMLGRVLLQSQVRARLMIIV